MMVHDEDPIIIRDYDSRWPGRFVELAARVQATLGDFVLRVEHIGSTAVPGLAAKPVIDLDVVVARTDVAKAIRLLSGLGYVHEGNLGIAGREAFRWPSGEARHHLLRQGLNSCDTLRSGMCCGQTGFLGIHTLH
jgi:GrpB-like predicted nucleotidyltransferase (UPF0157 family)